jgi:hypothetical protein
MGRRGKPAGITGAEFLITVMHYRELAASSWLGSQMSCEKNSTACVVRLRSLVGIRWSEAVKEFGAHIGDISAGAFTDSRRHPARKNAMLRATCGAISACGTSSFTPSNARRIRGERIKSRKRRVVLGRRSGAKDGGRGTDAVPVITVRVVERRKLSDGSVNLVGAFGMVARIHICFVRLKGNRRQFHALRVDGLTADDDDLGITRDLACRPDGMFELSAIHKRPDVRFLSISQ